jgi:hypothetical protein
MVSAAVPGDSGARTALSSRFLPPLPPNNDRQQPTIEKQNPLQACNPANYARVHAKPRCPAPGCKTALTVVNSYACKACGATVCLAHRHGPDHGCAAAAAAARARAAAEGGSSRPGAAAAFRAFRQALQRQGSGGKAALAPPPPRPPPPPLSAALEAAAAAQRLVGGGGRVPAPPAPRPPASPRSAAVAAAERRAASAAARPPSAATTAATASASPRARCPVCGLACGSARALRAHHTAAHPGAAPLPVCVLS